MSEVGFDEFGINLHDFFAIGDHSPIIFLRNKSKKFISIHEKILSFKFIKVLLESNFVLISASLHLTSIPSSYDFKASLM